MGKIRGGKGADDAYYYRNFAYACKLCGVSEENQAKVLRFFLYGHIPPDSVLLPHFSECSAFYSHIFINHYSYSRKSDVALLIYKRLSEKGMSFIIDPIVPSILSYDIFLAKVSIDKEIEMREQPTSRFELKGMVEIKDYGIKYTCGVHMHCIVSHAKVVRFEYTYKSSYAEVLASLHSEVKSKDGGSAAG
jgi:hypothetical protein